jgi:hypothetical protein
MYLVLYRDASISSITTPTKADTIEATIPTIPIGVKKAAKKKNPVTATIKMTKASYINAIALETSGLLIMLISTR